MIRLLLIVTIALSLAAATLSFLTRQKGEALMDSKKHAVAELESSKRQNSKLSEQVKTLETGKEELQTSLDAAKEQSTRLESEMAASKSELEAARAQKDASVAQLQQLKESVAAMESKLANPASLPADVEKIAALNADLVKARQDLEDQKKQAAQLKEKAEAAAKVAETVKARGAGLGTLGASAPTPAAKSFRAKTKGQVMAYNEGWNFVVISLGDKQGVTPESALEVRRDGKSLALLKITEVQPNQATAGIVLKDAKSRSSVKLKPGDDVVFIEKADPSEGDAASDSTANSPVPSAPVAAEPKPL